MTSNSDRIKTSLVSLMEGRMKSDDGLQALTRMAASALRAANGGRARETFEAKDLVQELFVKLIALRAKRGAASLVEDWNAMSTARFLAWLRTTLKNIAVDNNPYWDTQRGLRESVKGALEAGLPDESGLPTTLQRNGRFVGKFVGLACAALRVQGVHPDTRTLTSSLMEIYGLGDVFCRASEKTEFISPVVDACDALGSKETSLAIVDSFLAQAGEEGRTLLVGRRDGLARLATQYNVSVSTIHARYRKVESKLRAITKKLGADAHALSAAIQVLAPL